MTKIHICPATQHERVAVSVGYSSGRGYEMSVVHYHSGDLKPCQVDLYEHLVWTELIDVLLAELEERRPGTHPGGWEQLSLESAPGWERVSITP